MRVVLDVAALGSGLGGDETWVRGLLDGLSKIAEPGDEYPLLVPRGASLPTSVQDHPSFPVHSIPRRRGMVHFALDVPRALRGERADLVVSLTHAPMGTPVSSAMVVGDLSFVHHPELYPSRARLRLNALVPHQARRARLVIVPSEFTRHDIIDTYGLSAHQVVAVPNRVEPPVRLEGEQLEAVRAWASTAGVPERFVLYLGNLHPRKNLRRLIEAFGRVCRAPGLGDVELVVAGGRWWDADEVVGAACLAPPGSVIQVGRVGDLERRWLLAEASALAYPSLFEGFGLPPLEAMSYGTPVVASDRSAIPEVVADAAVLVDPFNVGEIADGLVAVLQDEALRTRLAESGPARAAQYSAKRVGEAAISAFRGTQSGVHRQPAAVSP